jgi:hypothetical protein
MDDPNKSIWIKKDYNYEKSKSEFFPLSNISNSQTLLCNENQQWVEYYSDHFGFNNQLDYKNSTVDILLIGDSFVQGFCIPPVHTIQSILNNEHKVFSVSLGMGGNGPIQNMATAMEYASFIRPRILYFVFTEANDLHDLTWELNNKTLSKYLFESNFSQNLAENQHQVDAELRQYLDFKLENHDANIVSTIVHKKDTLIRQLINVLSLVETRRILLPLELPREFELVINKTKNEMNRHGIKLIFVYLPEYARFSLKLYKNNKYEKIRNIVMKQGIDFLDLVEIFNNERDIPTQFWAKPYAHLTPEGHQLIARELMEHYVFSNER